LYLLDYGDYPMKTIAKFLAVLVALFSLSGCAQNTNSGTFQTIAIDTLIVTPMSLGKAEGSGNLQFSSSYEAFSAKIADLGIKAHGVAAFDESYFSRNNVIIIGLSTAPSYSFNVNKIVKTDKTATIYLNQTGPESADLSEIALCVIIGINREESKNVENFEVVIQKVITK
jgi:hypothetical protein